MADRKRRKAVYKRKKSIFSFREKLFILTMILIMLFCFGYLASYLFLPNTEIQSPFVYNQDLVQENINVVLNNEYAGLTNYPILKNNIIYVPVDFVKQHMDKYIFWDEAEQQLIITTHDKVLRMKPNSYDYYMNDNPVALKTPIITNGNLAYIPEDFLEDEYNFILNYKEKYNMLIIDNKTVGRMNAEVASKQTAVRYEPDKKSVISENLVQGTSFIIYEEIEKYTQIRTAEGLFGYVLTKDIIQKDYEKPQTPPEPPEYRPAKAVSGKINLLWDQITTAAANSNTSRKVKRAGLKVLSPTWFSFDEDKLNGDIIDIGDSSYVKWAHDNNYSVWAMLSDNYDSTVNHAVLSSTETRQHVINQLLALIDKYNLDGINIDFEALKKDDADCYLQFFRELYPLMKETGTVLSVDIYVPSPWSMYYNRAEVGKSVDYVCVMTYDEHTENSEKSGSVASISFVEKGINETLNEVPKEKVLMGLPYYDRTWREEMVDGAVKITTSSNAMSNAYDQFIKNGAVFEWDAVTGQNYGEYTKIENGNQVTYKIWLEDEKSIEEKLQVFERYDVAGIAGWRRGLEKDDIWDVLNKYVK